MLLPYQSPTGKVLWDSLSVILFRFYLIYSSGNCFETCSFLHNKKLQNLPQFFQKSNSSQSLSLIHPQFFHKLTNELRYCIHLSMNIFEWPRFGQCSWETERDAHYLWTFVCMSVILSLICFPHFLSLYSSL